MFGILRLTVMLGVTAVLPILAEELNSEISFAAPEYRVNEGSGSISLEVVRTGVLTNVVSVDYTVEAISATLDDYEPQTGTLTFNDGQAIQPVTVTILNDSLFEAAETVRVTLANATGEASLPPSPAAIVVIEDNDHPGGIDETFDFAPSAYIPPDDVWEINSVLALEGSTIFYAGTNSSPAPTIGLTDAQGAGLRASGVREYNDGVQDIDGSFYLAGYGYGGVVSHYSGKISFDSALGFPQRAGLTGVGNVIRLTPDRLLLVGGSFFLEADTNIFGLARLFRNGARDESFATNDFSGREVTALAIDGDLFYASSVSTNDASEVGHTVARYLADGARDAAFAQVQFNGRIEVLQLMPDGDLLAGGSFTEAAGQPHAHLVRLSPAGEVVTALQPASPDGPVHAVAFEPNGQLLVAGDFSQIGGVARARLARLTPEGELDADFDPGTGPNAPILTLAVQSDGGIVVGGAFTEFSGKICKGLVRLNGGTISEAAYLYWDRDFSTVQEQAGSASISLVRSGGSNEALTVSIQVAGGTASPGLDFGELPSELTFEPGQTRVEAAIPLVRDGHGEDRETIILQVASAGENLLITRGITTVRIQDAESPASRDTTFGLDAVQRPGAIAVQEDGKFLVSSSGVIRLHPDGTPDETFRADVFTNMSPGGTIIGMLPVDDKIYVYGSFAFNQGGVNLAHILRLEQDGTFDPGFRPPYSVTSASFTGITSMVPQPGGFLFVTGFGLQFSIESLTGQGMRNLYRPPAELRTAAVNQLILHPEGGFVAAGDNLPLARLDATGTISTNFAPALTGSAEYIQPFQGGFLVGGELHHASTGISHSLVLVSQDGTFDTNFHADVNGPVDQALPLRNGRILISGNFTQVDGIPRNRIARLHSDGSLDTTFDPGLGLDAPANVLAEAVDGKVLVGGWNHAHYDGEPVPDLIRLTDLPQPGEFSFIETLLSVSETAGEAGVAIQRLGGSSGTATLRVETVALGAIAGVHFVESNLQVQFQDAVFSPVEVSIPVLHDPGVTGDRTFGVLLYSESTGELLDYATVLITDSEADGVVTTYTPQIEPFHTYGSILLEPDGTVLLSSSSSIKKWDANGGLDESFALPLSPNFGPADLARQEDGKLIVLTGGPNGFPQPGGHLARFHPDGSADLSFSTMSNSVNRGSSTWPVAVESLSDGGVLAFWGGAIHRLDTNGVNVAPPVPAPSTFHFAVPLCALPNGEALVGNPDGARAGGLYLFKVNNQGSIVPEFSLSPAGQHMVYIREIARQPDGKILIVGAFNNIEGLERYRIARLFPDGQVDPSFDAGLIGGLFPSHTTEIINSVEILPDGDIMIAGRFAMVQGVSRRHLARLAPDGTLRQDWDAQVQGSEITEIKLLDSGELAIYGAITNVGGIEVHGIARIHMAQPIPPSAAITSPENGAIFSLDGSIPVQIQAYDPDGFLQTVKLLVDGQVQSEFDAPPYETTLTLEPGAHTVQAEAIDAGGLATLSLEVEVNVEEEEVPLEITLASAAGGEWELTVPARAGADYQLQSSSDLVNWINVGEATAGAEAVRFPITVGGAGHLFYRVLVVK